jgi:hypothetical protein
MDFITADLVDMHVTLTIVFNDLQFQSGTL